MNSRFVALAVTAFAFALTSLAHVRRAEAEEITSILYTCNLSFKAEGRSIYVGIGYSEIEGRGTVSCYDLLTGATRHQPVKVKARGPGAGLGITGLVVSGAATGVGVTRGPDDLLGRYALLRGNAAVGVGAAAGVGLRVSKGAVTVDLSVEAQGGLGVGIDLMWVDISKDGIEKTEPAKVTASNLAPAPPAPTQTIYLSEGQPLEIVDAQGRVLKTIYLKRAVQ